MHTILKSAFAAVLATAVAAPAFAAETRVVPANRASAIFFYYTASHETCHSGARPKLHVRGGPAHGNITSLWKAFKMGKEGGRCAGTPLHGTLVIYKPAPGYHGADKVSLTFSEDAGNDYFVRPKEYTVNITVK